MPQYESPNDLLWSHLQTVPTFRALLRATEARFYRRTEIPEPVLDLGCGDGHFATRALNNVVSVGVDPWWNPLTKAQGTGAYEINVQALGDTLPLPAGTFSSVISNSVLEHIPDVQPVLKEINRVMRPAGRLIVTMPSHLFAEYLGGARLLEPVGLDNAYRRFFNFVSRHAHTDSPDQWSQRLGEAGFQIVRWQYYFSRSALQALEIGHLQGLPSAVIHAITGHWVIAPWKGNLAWTENWVRPYYEEEAPAEGAYIFVIAEKVSSGSTSSYLPPPRPFSRDELAAPGSVPGDDIQAAPDSTPDRHIGSEPSVEAADAPAPSAASRIERTETAGPAPAVSAGLLVVTVLFAMLGQAMLVTDPPSRVGGATYLVLAAASAAALVAYRRQGSDSGIFRVSGINPRRWLFPLALLLALLAQSVASTGTRAAPLVPVALWLAAIAVGVVALGESNEAEKDLVRSGPALGEIGWIVVLLVLALGMRLVLITEHPFMLDGVEASNGLDAVAVLEGKLRNPFATGWLTNPTMPAFILALPVSILGQTVLGLRILAPLVGAFTVVATFLFGRRLWGTAEGAGAAIFLAGTHVHLHYSRLGTTNIWDPLIVLVAFGVTIIALERGSRGWWLVAGITAGIGAYSYFSSHLLPLMMLAFLLYLLVAKRRLLRQQAGNILAAVAIAAVVALPQMIYYDANPGLFFERADTLGILQSDWLAQEMVRSGESPLALIGSQFLTSALAFNASLDTSTSYNPGIPILRYWPAIFFILGVVVCIIRMRRPQYAMPLIWLGTTVVFAGALLVNPPASHRYLVAAPAWALVTAIGIVWSVEEASNLFQRVRPVDNRLHIAVVTILACLLVVGDVLFYFGEYRESDRFGDRNTEIAYEVGNYLQSLDGPWNVYFHGPPSMYVDFPTLEFLAPAFTRGVSLHDVARDSDVDTVPGPTNDTGQVHIFLPERRSELKQVQAQFPDGRIRVFSGRLADPLFFGYEVAR